MSQRENRDSSSSSEKVSPLTNRKRSRNEDAFEEHSIVSQGDDSQRFSARNPESYIAISSYQSPAEDVHHGDTATLSSPFMLARNHPQLAQLQLRSGLHSALTLPGLNSPQQGAITESLLADWIIANLASSWTMPSLATLGRQGNDLVNAAIGRQLLDQQLWSTSPLPFHPQFSRAPSARPLVDTDVRRQLLNSTSSLNWTTDHRIYPRINQHPSNLMARSPTLLGTTAEAQLLSLLLAETRIPPSIVIPRQSTAPPVPVLAGFLNNQRNIAITGSAVSQMHIPPLETRTTSMAIALPAILAQPEDSEKLSSHQVFLRQQIEAFEATDDDVTSHTRGRNKPVSLGQVGIRCRHCSHLPVSSRQKGSTYFPARLIGLYQAAQNMSAAHMQTGQCSEMPESIKAMFAQFTAARVGCSGAGRPYWAESAKKLCLFDSDDGIIRRTLNQR